jgi:hypothetical protein
MSRAVSKKTILILLSNPKDTPQLELLKEIEQLKAALISLGENKFDVHWEVNVKQEDWLGHISRVKPQIIHFCGHGTREGLFIDDSENNYQLLPNEYLVNLLKEFADRVECVLLNACDTEPLAKALANHINHAIGMNRPVKDKSAMSFAKYFYGQLGIGESVKTAFNLAINEIFRITSPLQNESSSFSDSQDRKFTVVSQDDTTVKNENQEYKIPVLFSNPHPVTFPSLTPSEEVGKGLSALKYLMSNPKIYAEVKVGKDKLQEACNQIQIVSTYKDVHDELQHLEIDCYQSIVDEERWFSENQKMSLRNLRTYKINLQRIYSSLQEIAQRKIDDQPILEEIDWFMDIKQAQTALDELIETSNINKFKAIQKFLSYVLPYQLTVMDAELNHTIKTLSLPPLVKLMSNIRENLTRKNLVSDQELEKIQYFQEGVKALEDLQQKFTSLIGKHNAWQRIDEELRLVQVVLNINHQDIDTQSCDDLKLSWSRLKNKLDKEYNDCEEEWAIQLKQLGEKINNFLAMKTDILEFREIFQDFRGQASNHFFDLDKELKSFCEQLKNYINKPLTSIVEMMAS